MIIKPKKATHIQLHKIQKLVENRNQIEINKIIKSLPFKMRSTTKISFKEARTLIEALSN